MSKHLRLTHAFFMLQYVLLYLEYLDFGVIVESIKLLGDHKGKIYRGYTQYQEKEVKPPMEVMKL